MRTVRTGETNCPVCGVPIDAAAHLTREDTPKPDDLSICVACRAVLQFNEDLSLRAADPSVVEQCREELAEIMAILASRDH